MKIKSQLRLFLALMQRGYFTGTTQYKNTHQTTKTALKVRQPVNVFHLPVNKARMQRGSRHMPVASSATIVTNSICMCVYNVLAVPHSAG